MRRSKLISTIASAAAVHFLKVSGREALFEAKLSELPSSNRVLEYFFWQRRYCFRNATTIALRRALHNLLRNAVEAGAHAIAIALSVEGAFLLVTVRDDGPGMGPEAAARAFEPFFTTKARGTGLGLAISRQEVEDVGGSLRCESESGKGSCFSVRLPVTAC
jgi:signal transduction histidine kinase